MSRRQDLRLLGVLCWRPLSWDVLTTGELLTLSTAVSSVCNGAVLLLTCLSSSLEPEMSPSPGVCSGGRCVRLCGFFSSCIMVVLIVFIEM